MKTDDPSAGGAGALRFKARAKDRPSPPRVGSSEDKKDVADIERCERGRT